MVTTVGLNTHTETLVKNLIELEYDAVAAYYEAMKRFDTEAFKLKFHDFVTDHKNHLYELTKFAEHQQFSDIPAEGDAKAVLTKGKIVLANLISDRAILTAMATNEDDTVTAYQRACDAAELPADLRTIVTTALADEQRHRAWMQENAHADAQDTNQAA